ncbi:MAG: hypothetical protein QM487_09100 [Candidatus Marithrix sp.]
MYQAYLRYLKIQKERPAKFILLNIWTDDHFRALDSWHSIRFGQGSSAGFTIPYLRYNPANASNEEKKNICNTIKDIYRLTELNFVREHFYDDFVMRLMLQNTKNKKISKQYIYNLKSGGKDHQYIG